MNAKLKKFFELSLTIRVWLLLVFALLLLGVGHCAHADQVYTCSDSGADGRAMSPWPNCTAASYQDASATLVVATNNMTATATWKLASKLTSNDRVFSHDQNAWVANSSFTWAAATGTATVSWASVATATSYSMYCGTAAADLTKLGDTTATTYTVTGLAPSTWYFAVTASNSAGESPLSVIVSKSISAKPGAPQNLKVQ